MASNHDEGIRFDDFLADNSASFSAFTDNSDCVRAISSFKSAPVTNSLIQGNGIGILN